MLSSAWEPKGREFKSLPAHFSILPAHRKIFFNGHLRLRKSITSSGVVQTYSNPVSINCLASPVFLVAFEVFSSLWRARVC